MKNDTFQLFKTESLLYWDVHVAWPRERESTVFTATLWSWQRDLCSTPIHAALLFPPWKRRFTIIFSAWWLRTSSNLTGKKSKNKWKTWISATPRRFKTAQW